MLKVKDILKSEEIIKISKEETLAKALSSLSSSHDAGFVFSENGEFLGVVNPYLSVIKNGYPGSVKVKNILFHPPKLSEDDSLEKAARLMMESKIHYLPVFDAKNKFIGIASVRRVLRSITPNKLSIKIKEILKTKKPLIVIKENDSLDKALNEFRKHKISKLVVIDEGFKLKGIFSFYDVFPYLLKPKERMGSQDRAGDRDKFLHFKVKNLMKSLVLTLRKENSLKDALDLILEKRIGSVVIVDEHNHPHGIITTKDILKTAFYKKSFSTVTIERKEFPEKYNFEFESFIGFLGKLLQKKFSNHTVKISVSEERNRHIFVVVLQFIKDGQVRKFFKKEDKNFVNLLKKLKNALSK